MLGVDFAGGYSMAMKFEQNQADQINLAIDSGSLRENLAVGTGIDGGQINRTADEAATGEQRLRVDFPMTQTLRAGRCPQSAIYGSQSGADSAR